MRVDAQRGGEGLPDRGPVRHHRGLGTSSISHSRSVIISLKAVVHVACTMLMPRMLSSAIHAAAAGATAPDWAALLVRRRDSLLALGGRRRRANQVLGGLFVNAVQLLARLLLLWFFQATRTNTATVIVVITTLVQIFVLADQIDDIGAVVWIHLIMTNHVDHCSSMFAVLSGRYNTASTSGGLVNTIVVVVVTIIATSVASKRGHTFGTAAWSVDIQRGIFCTTHYLVRRGCTSPAVHIIINHLIFINIVKCLLLLLLLLDHGNVDHIIFLY